MESLASASLIESSNLGDQSSMATGTADVVVHSGQNEDQIQKVVVIGVVLLASSLCVLISLLTYCVTIKCYKDYCFKRKRIVNREPKMFKYSLENDQKKSLSRSVLNWRYMEMDEDCTCYGDRIDNVRKSMNSCENTKINLSSTKLNSRYEKKIPSIKRVNTAKNGWLSTSARNEISNSNRTSSFQPYGNRLNIISGNLNFSSERQNR